MTNWKNCIINDHTGKRPPSAQNGTQNNNKQETQPTDFSAIASPLSDPYRIQTCNLLIRSQTLYSIELRDQFFVFSGAKILPFFELASILANFFSKNF